MSEAQAAQVVTNTPVRGRLHEILAVEGGHEGRAKKLVEETVQAFKNKEHLFKGRERTLTMFGRDGTNEVVLAAVEDKEKVSEVISSTVPESLNYLASLLAGYYNVLFQKEATNQTAKASVYFRGNEILTNVPVTFLLSMETRLKEVRRVIDEIPTLEPTINWEADTNNTKSNVWKAPAKHDLKTLKKTAYNIAVAPTDRHPAQVYPYDTTENVGQYTEVVFSGKISSATKARLLENVDTLMQSVKKARQRANAVELVPHDNVGEVIFANILGSFFDPATANTSSAI